MKARGFNFLRPYLDKEVRRVWTPARSSYVRFYTSSTRPHTDEQAFSNLRREEREGVTGSPNRYPRIGHDPRALTCRAFRQRYSFLKPEETKGEDFVTVYGRVLSTRIAGSKLVFLDILQDGHRLQSMSNLQTLLESDIDEEKFRGLFSSIRRGGVVSVTGIPHRTRRGELTILSAELPKSLAPGLQLLPTELLDPETRIRNRHVDLLVNQQTADTLRLRSEVVQCVRDFLLRDDFLEVQTPILADGAGGAVARPFSTSATEFPEKHVNLRIAPELWLKRLILGGLDRVFEIGPSFRNEGLDLTHNPEFTTCEFYKSYADLEELVGMTETLLSALSHHVQSLKSQKFTSLSPLSIDFTPPFKRLSFIPVLESAISLTLPDLSSPSAFSSLLSIFESLSIPVPSRPTLPRLLDKLATVYLEPQCESAPTFITHHPECLAPLSKSFFDPVTEQRVSARVELFVQGRELINAYEEENSPFEQRRKFVEQLQYKGHDEDEGMSVDESYLEALEWGLPPTGGWGCGIDRLVMLFSGAKRIGDVLSFGSLKNVVGLAGATRMKRGELEDNETEEGRNI